VAPAKLYFAFGEFRLDASERQLLRGDVPIPLAPKIFDTLLLLVENPNHLIEKEEFMRKVWPDIAVGDDALARNIFHLRKTLGGSNGSGPKIETVPTRGYRFVAEVRRFDGGEDAVEDEKTKTEPEPMVQVLPEPPPRPTPSPSFWAIWRPRLPVLALAIGVGCLAGYITYWLLVPPKAVKVGSSKPLTVSSKVDPWQRIVSDGSRIYFLERAGDRWKVMQTSVSGGEPQVLNTPFPWTIVLDVSPDRSNFLIASFADRMHPMPLWTWPTQGGPPKRVGDLTVRDAGWCPNNHQIVYAEDDGIYQADEDGRNAHQFLATDGDPGDFAWSPDGRVLRFTLYSHKTVTWALWEVNADGTNPHPLLPGWDAAPEDSRGNWSPDGKYFFFQSKHVKTLDVWVMREGQGLFGREPRGPVRVTNGPWSYSSPAVSRDGRRVFAYSVRGFNDFVRYDAPSHQFLPVLNGIRGDWVDYSRDGQWIAYGATGETTFGRMRVDGSERLDLTPTGLGGHGPHWSPDGRSLAFTGLTASGVLKAFIISADGGAPKELFADDRNQLDPAWSPDGKLMAFVREVSSSAPTDTRSVIHLLDLSTNHLERIAAQDGMRAPTWSPDGRFLAAVTEDLRHLRLLDLRTQRWSELADGTTINGRLAWSKDGKYLYYQDLLGEYEPIYRLRISDHSRELMTDFKQILGASPSRVAFVGLSPDDSPLATVLRTGSDVYALDLDIP
jgi:Tol biopolymer transport system component/DNA-binding winged helix-turn-helix (wHTH) protein